VSLFGRRQDPGASAPGASGASSPRAAALPADAHLKPSILSEGVTVHGDVITPQGILHVDGTIAGQVRVTTLVVGPAGAVEGNVVAESVTVKGAVRGDITCDELVLAATARVTGDVQYRTLTVQGGAALAGTATRRT
jgi:cytoskeletal protein CcmA (bactofilin family)